jgi:hypothetical protein
VTAVNTMFFIKVQGEGIVPVARVSADLLLCYSE